VNKRFLQISILTAGLAFGGTSYADGLSFRVGNPLATLFYQLENVGGVDIRFGVKYALDTRAGGSIGPAADVILWRHSTGIEALSGYAGVGGIAGFFFNGGYDVGLHGLYGLEYALDPHWATYAEVSVGGMWFTTPATGGYPTLYSTGYAGVRYRF
jgi:hypothetical protein